MSVSPSKPPPTLVSPIPKPPPTLIDVNGVADRLNSSTRHVWRLRDRGILPPSINIGSLVRWNSEVIDEWIRRGCPPHRRQGVRA
jgi:predicted DNA-binding transcriptional regulator AlpA